MVPLTISDLKDTAQKIRKDVIEMIYRAGSGHPGGSLSSTDILVALYFGNILNFDLKDPKFEKRDRLILSAGHVVPSLYAVLGRLGFFNEDVLSSLRNLGSPLQGHPTFPFTEFVETTTGSLGQGLSVGLGMAVALKMKKGKSRVVVLSSDGEQDEGSHWEAVMSAGFHRIENLGLIIDNNGMQIGGNTEDILGTQPLEEKYKSFGWDVFQVDGHDFGQLLSAFSRFNEKEHKPKVVICRTIRGKGVSFMEGSDKYHACTLSEDEYRRAIEELE